MDFARVRKMLSASQTAITGAITKDEESVDGRGQKLCFSKKILCAVCGFIISVFMSSSVLSILFPEPAFAQSAADELQIVTVEGQSKAATAPEAIREITAWATAATAREQVIELIGESRFQKSKASIETRIIKQSSRFIPFVNPGEAVQQADGSWKMSVELRLSTASLRKMVLDAGLLSEAEGPASIVPMVAFTDRAKAVSTRWWLGEEKDDAHKFLVQMSKVFHDRMQGEFVRQGFHVVKPIGSVQSPLPEALRIERPAQSDLGLIGQFFRAPMVLKGDIRFREAKELPGAVGISIKLFVVQAANGRTIAELSRQFVTDPGNFEVVVRNKMIAEVPDISKDLAAQVTDAWQRGTINANLIRLSVRGELSPKELGGLKQSLMRAVKDIKDLKERMFERGQVVFEVDYTGDAKKLAQALQGAQIASFETKLSESSDKGLVLDVKTR